MPKRKAETERLAQSWVDNAVAWTEAVRAGQIASRAVTDAAILAAVRRHQPRRVLDVGCGEGWLCRVLADEGVAMTGVDASPLLVEAARTKGGGAFQVLAYGDLVADASAVPGPFDVAVCNFALLGEDVGPLLAALRTRLSPAGHLLIQTLHPWRQMGTGPYADGWREERFDGFGSGTWSPMPWYFRTLGSWLAVLQQAGYQLHRVGEPGGTNGQPASLILDAVSVR